MAVLLSANGLTPSRVEERRGSLGHSASPRFPCPLIEPDVRISRIRLCASEGNKHLPSITATFAVDNQHACQGGPGHARGLQVSGRAGQPDHFFLNLLSGAKLPCEEATRHGRS